MFVPDMSHHIMHISIIMQHKTITGDLVQIPPLMLSLRSHRQLKAFGMNLVLWLSLSLCEHMYECVRQYMQHKTSAGDPVQIPHSDL